MLKEWSARTLQGYPATWSDPVLAWLRREIAPEYTRRLLGRRDIDIAHAMFKRALHLAARYQARSGGLGAALPLVAIWLTGVGLPET